jgi:Glycosyltransferase 61
VSTTSKTPLILSCDLTNYRSSVCEIYTNVRIHGNSSSIYFNSTQSDSEANKTLRIHPYTRRFDGSIMKEVREVTISPLHASTEAPKCDIEHNITAIVFALTGYTGNYFHAFSDVLLPLFITARQFEGEVQMLITGIHPWFIGKYKKVLDEFSNYEIIDFNKENKVHCYPRAIVGLYSHGELIIDPSITPRNYSMVDFSRLMRRVYSLKRDSAINLVAGSKKKPRLLIIARGHTRKIINVGDIVALAEMLGFEVVVNEASFHTRVGEFARMVNTFDVMMGVHGAGLTNEVFLPTNAVVIQIVPFGNLEWVAEHDFGDAARNMMLRYIQYSISEEESTLIDLYPRDHAVFRDPNSVGRQGWATFSKIYLSQQNVKLNTTRFKPVLTSALGLLGYWV